MRPTPLLVLDFDGVLHSVQDGTDRPFSRMPLLADALRGPLAQMDVLVSSDWRLFLDLEALRQHFPADLHARVVSVTPRPEHVHARQWGGWVQRYPRHAEVLAWMHQHHGDLQHPWVALDDRPELFPPGDPRVVAVPGALALQPHHLERVAQLLSASTDFPPPSNHARSQL